MTLSLFFAVLIPYPPWPTQKKKDKRADEVDESGHVKKKSKVVFLPALKFF